MDLLEFVRSRMKPSSYYQPLIIRSLIEAGGRMPRGELAKKLLVEDSFAIEKAGKTLMRWPRSTLKRHGIVDYEPGNREFVLLASFGDEQRELILAECTSAIARWDQIEAPKVASRFYGVIEAAGGRCLACGISGDIRPIDVDHVIPRNQAKNGKVTLSDGTQVRVDDRRNLQALCSRCNRGKRDASTMDFRATPQRLTETIALALEKAGDLGYDTNDMLRMLRLARM